MKTQLERARERHADLVKQHAKLSDKRDKLFGQLQLAMTRLSATTKAIGRSSKRIDKLVMLAPVNAGPVEPAKAVKRAAEPSPVSVASDDGLEIPPQFRRTESA